MNTVVGSVIVTFSGMTLVAYNHPGDFQRLAFAILIISGIITMLVASYVLGVTVVREAVYWNENFSSHLQVYIENIADNLQPPYWIWPASIAFQLYIVFLCFLCSFARSDKYENQDI